MLFQIYAIFIKEMKLLYKDREALALLFIMPAFFILVMSFALKTVYETGSSEHPIEILVINEDKGMLSQKFLKDLKKIEVFSLIEEENGDIISLELSERLIKKGQYSLALHLGNNFSANF